MSASLRDLAADGGLWCALGLVALDEGAEQHWEVNEDGDLMISVELHDQGRVVWAQLGALVAWRIPEVGEEVLVAFDGGEVEGEAVIVRVLSSGDPPANLEPGLEVIRGDAIRLVSAVASENFVLGQQLKALLSAILDAIIAHNHQAVIGVTGPPLNAPAFTAAKEAWVTSESILSQKVKGE